MFDHVIVAVDGQQGGRDAIALASALVARGGRLTLAHINLGFPVAAKGDPPEYVNGEQERSQEILRNARREAGVDADLKALGAPTVSEGLHRLTERCGADLLVIGSDQRTTIGRVLPGASVKATLTNAPCAVAIAPCGYAKTTRALTRVGVAFDSSLESRRALAVARVLSKRFSATLSAWHVVELPTFRVSPGKVLRDLFENVAVELESMPEVERHEVYGDTAEALAECSDAVDLLVIGSCDRGPIGRVIHGNISGRLAGICRCPLLVMVRGTRARGSDHNVAAELVDTGPLHTNSI